MSYSSEKVKKWRKNTKDRMVAAMGGCCQICGYSKSTNALEFHHIDPTVKEKGFGD
jgi:5-methylcytosine-specific restriction endonuclease McrA